MSEAEIRVHSLPGQVRAVRAVRRGGAAGRRRECERERLVAARRAAEAGVLVTLTPPQDAP